MTTIGRSLPPASPTSTADLLCAGKVDLLEGEPQPERIVVIEFPDADTARRWYQSEEYQTALKIRRAASRGRVLLVEGTG